jgi:hypothetical protein
MLGEIGPYPGFALLALVGIFMIRSSMHSAPGREFEATWSRLIDDLVVCLDSLGVGVALPGVPITPCCRCR